MLEANVYTYLVFYLVIRIMDIVSINQLCEKYKCELLENYEYNKTLKLMSSCGHVSIVSFNKFKKHKLGVYCAACLDILQTEKRATCFHCKNVFVPTGNTFLYCGTKCSNSRVMTADKKNRISSSLLSRHGHYKNDDGSLKSNEDIKEMQKKRRRNASSLDSEHKEKVVKYMSIPAVPTPYVEPKPSTKYKPKSKVMGIVEETYVDI